MASYKFTILSLKGRVFEGSVESAAMPGLQGRFAVLAGHAPMIAAVVPGLTEVRDSAGATHLFFTANGYAEVTREETTLLVGLARKAATAEEARAMQAEHAEVLASWLAG